MSKLNLPLVWELTKRDYAERFAGSVLGSLWALILPLVNLAIYIIIFGQLMGARLPGKSATSAYGIYLCSGLIPWTAFSSTLSRSCSIFLEKRHLIAKINISLPSLLLFVSLSETVTFLITMSILSIFLVFSGQFPSFESFCYIPLIYILQQFFAYGLGLLTATLTVFIRDLKEVVTVTLQIWFWFTPIVYLSDILPVWVKKLLVYNPAYVFIEPSQSIFVYGKIPDILPLLIFFVVTLILFFLSISLFKFLEKDLRDFL